MAIHFLDSSAIVKHYFQEQGHDWVEAIHDPATGDEAIKGEIKGLQEAILDFLETRFSMSVYMQVRQAITPIQDVAQLRNFSRQLAGLSDKEEVLALLKRCFSTQ